MTTTKLTTAEQFMAIDEDGHFDLIDGEVYRLSPAKHWHGTISGRLSGWLFMYAQLHGGESPTSEPSFLVTHEPDSVLCPDACYVSATKMATIPDGWDRWYPFAPDIAVEVISRSETRRTVGRKVALYLAAGSAEVWVVDPRRETLTVHRSDAEPHVYHRDDTLDGGETLPGFTLPLARIFR